MLGDVRVSAEPRFEAHKGWHRIIGPWPDQVNGTFTCIALDPSNPNATYVGSRSDILGWGIWRTTDMGETWERKDEGIPRGSRWLLENKDASNAIYDIAVDLNNSRRLYAGVYGGVYRSDNAGDSWYADSGDNRGKLFARGVLPLGPVYRVWVHPSREEVVLAGTDDGIYRTEDGGHTWKLVNRTGSPNPEGYKGTIASIVSDPDNPDVVLATGHGVATIAIGTASKDDASTFAEQPYEDRRVGTIPVAISAGIVKSIDAGVSWSTLTYQPKHVFCSLVVQPHSDVVLAGCTLATWTQVYIGEQGVIRSSNGGKDWSAPSSGLSLGKNAPVVTSLAADESAVYATTNSGVFASTDHGATWRDISFGLPVNVETRRVPTVHLVVDGGENLFLSTSSGLFWLSKKEALGKDFQHKLRRTEVEVPLDGTIPTVSGYWGYKEVDFELTGKSYKHLGFPSEPYTSGEAVFDIVGYERFKAAAGVQDWASCDSAVISIRVDDKLVWQRTVKRGDPASEIDVVLTGHKSLLLRRDMSGDGADLVEPRLIKTISQDSGTRRN